MTELAPINLALLVLWGTLVALDLVSVPQAMLSRPLVAGTVAGWILGDVALRRRLGSLRTRATLLPVLRIAVVSAVAALVGWAVLNVTDPLLGTSTTGSLGSVVIGTVVIGAATLAGLVVARVPEIREPLAAVRARVGRG